MNEMAKGLRIALSQLLRDALHQRLIRLDRVARERGRLQAAVAARGANPRTRSADLAIAATANVYGVPLLTHNVKDFKVISDLVDAHTP